LAISLEPVCLFDLVSVGFNKREFCFCIISDSKSENSLRSEHVVAACSLRKKKLGDMKEEDSNIPGCDMPQSHSCLQI
jgi:hypothetical protein